jgi:aminopeptidase N
LNFIVRKAQLICFLFLGIFAFFLSAYSQDSQIQTLELEARRAFFETQASGSGKNIDVKHYRCHWKINPNQRFINGKVSTTFLTKDTASFLLFDFYNGLTVDSVVFRGQKISSQFPSSQLFRIALGQVLPSNTLDSISIFYKGIPANSGFGAFNQAFHAGTPIIWTMSCPYAARDWWPCKQDLEDKPDSIDLIISTPSQYRAAGNGLLVAEYLSGTDKVFHWKHKYPIATYLIATAVTNYAAYTQKVKLASQPAGDSLPVVNFVYPESQASAQINTRRVLPILQFYDSLLAPYPFAREKYGHAQFGWGGGMEHQTMSFMTDFSFGLQAHELAHQWFGDHITCKSWRDVWLNEGWATYMTAVAQKRFATANFLSWLTTTINQITANGSGSVWVDDTTNINRVFDYRLTYQKGAMLLHMLRWELGVTDFWAGVRSYQADPLLKFGFSSTSQFITHLEASSGKNLQSFVNQWFKGQGHPIVQVKLIRDGLNMQLILTQTTSHPSVPFFNLKVPIRFRATGMDTTLIFYPENPVSEFNFQLPLSPTTLTFDPEKWLLARSSVQLITRTMEVKSQIPEIAAFPNPFSEVLNLKNKGLDSRIFEIMNANGQVIQKGEIHPEFQNAMNTKDFPPGFYFIKIGKGEVATQTFKLVKY